MNNDTRREPTSPNSWEQGRPRSKASLATGNARLGAVPRFLFLAYISTALLYTLYYTVAEPLLHRSAADHGAAYDPVKEALELAGRVQEDAGEQIWGGGEGHQTHQHGEVDAAATAVNQAANQASSIASNRIVSWREYGRIHGVEWGVDTISWNPSQASDKLSMSMAEDFFLSKAFGESLQPSKVIPYYYRATSHFGAKDITITTLVTSNRFKVLAALAETYQGPISVTIHVTNDASSRQELLDSLHALYTTSPYMSTYVDVHLVVDSFDRQFNMWRNVAKFFSRTDFVMMLDVDFAICTDFRSRILRSSQVMAKLEQGNAAFVVPAFEYAAQEDGLDPATFPKQKADLVELVKQDKIGMFHAFWKPGHGSTNYTRYYEAKASEVYKVNQYTHAYEPYVIFKKEGTPYCDERFIGYGANKAACLFELYLSGVSFYVLPDDFLIHQSHEYAEAARKNERRYNRKLYLDFREELCFRYLDQFITSGLLETPTSRNLLTECKKIKGFSGAAGRFISASTGPS